MTDRQCFPCTACCQGWLMALSRKLSVPLMFCEHIFKNGRVVGKKKLGYGPPDFVHEVKYGIGPEDILMSE